MPNSMSLFSKFVRQSKTDSIIGIHEETGPLILFWVISSVRAFDIFSMVSENIKKGVIRQFINDLLQSLVLLLNIFLDLFVKDVIGFVLEVVQAFIVDNEDVKFTLGNELV